MSEDMFAKQLENSRNNEMIWRERCIDWEEKYIELYNQHVGLKETFELNKSMLQDALNALHDARAEIGRLERAYYGAT